MKYLLFLLVLSSCSPETQLVESSKSRISECEKACQDDYGKETHLEHIGAYSGICYCKEE